MAAVFEKLRIENEECLEALMDQHARQSEASKKESEMWDRRWKEKEGTSPPGAPCAQGPGASRALLGDHGRILVWLSALNFLIQQY